MWQSPPHGSLFFFGQSLANLLTIIGNGGWSRTIISGVPDVLKLEIEVGIEPTFAVLQTAAKTTIDNSTIGRSIPSRTGFLGFGVPGTTTYTMLLLKWHSRPDSNWEFSVRSAAVYPLAYGSIEILKVPISTRIHVKVWGQIGWG